MAGLLTQYQITFIVLIKFKCATENDPTKRTQRENGQHDQRKQETSDNNQIITNNGEDCIQYQMIPCPDTMCSAKTSCLCQCAVCVND